MATAGLTHRLQDLRDRRQILVQAPRSHDQRDATCGEVLSITDPETTDVLMVLLGESPGEAIDRWRAHVSEDTPAKMGVITTTETARSGADHAPVSARAPNLTAETIDDPGNLTTLGVRITERLSEWEDDGNPQVVCFDSLTHLLQYVDREQAFKFLHTLRAWLTRNDGIAHYHLDPAVIDDQTTNTMASLMDAILTVDSDGEVDLQLS